MRSSIRAHGSGEETVLPGSAQDCEKTDNLPDQRGAPFPRYFRVADDPGATAEMRVRLHPAYFNERTALFSDLSFRCQKLVNSM